MTLNFNRTDTGPVAAIELLINNRLPAKPPFQRVIQGHWWMRVADATENKSPEIFHRRFRSGAKYQQTVPRAWRMWCYWRMPLERER